MKKYCCLLLALAVLLFPAAAGASSHIDLSRVKFSSGSEPLVFEFGSMSMDGELIQKVPFTKEEINKLVKETLKAMKLTELDIKEANEAVSRARLASEFTKEDMERVKKNLLTTLKSVPASSAAADVLDTIDDYMESSSWDDIGTATEKLMDKQVSDWVKDTAGGFVDQAGQLGKNLNKANQWLEKLTAIGSFCDMMMDEHMRTKQKWKDIADGANAKRLLNEFYYQLQRKIDNYKHESDSEGWAIRFMDTMDGRNFTFFGVDSNYQIWTLILFLDQVTANDYGSAAGYYEGEFTITADHEMSSFETRAHEAIQNMEPFGEAIREMKNMPGYKVTLSTASKGDAYISRTISGTCTAIIEDSGNILFSMEEKTDLTEVIFSDIAVSLDYSTGSSSIIKSGGHVTFHITAEEEDIVIGGVTNDMSVIAPNVNFSHTISGSGSMNVGWDDSIWKPWDGTEKILRHAD
jgi:hypothetical protein